MKLNRKWMLVIALVLSLTVATAGTLAYLTDRDTVENTFTMGNVDIEVEEEFVPDSPMYPGVEVEKKAGITNTHATEPAWVWMTVSVPTELVDYIDLEWLEGAPVDAQTRTDVHPGYTSYVVKHPEMLEPGETTDMYLQGVTLSKLVDYQDGSYGYVKDGKFTAVDGLDDLKIIVDGFAIQTEKFADVDEAYEAYVGQWGELGNGGESGANGGLGAAVEIGSSAELVSTVKEAFENGETSIVVDANNADIGALNAVITKNLVPEGKRLTIMNANITGTSMNNTVAGTVVFNKCTFSNDTNDHVIHFDTGTGEIIFDDCEIKGWAAFAAGNTVEMNNCTITGNGITGTVKIYGEGTLTDCTIDFGNVTNKDRIPYYIAAAGAGSKVTLNNCDLVETEIWAETETSVVDAGELGTFTKKYVLVENNAVVANY